jgi:hypothetical protein
MLAGGDAMSEKGLPNRIQRAIDGLREGRDFPVARGQWTMADLWNYVGSIIARGPYEDAGRWQRLMRDALRITGPIVYPGMRPPLYLRAGDEGPVVTFDRIAGARDAATVPVPAGIGSDTPTVEVVGHEWQVVLPGSTFRPDGSARHRIRDRDGTIHEYETGPKARTWRDDPPMI